jgi:hypothetical protein
MGNVIVFRRRIDGFPLETSRDPRLTSRECKDMPTGPSRRDDPARSASERSPFPFNSFAATRFARGLAKTSQKPDHDAYLLVLLADQEMIAGRDAEARCLLDAAYAVFDRNINGQWGCKASG